MKKSLYLVIIEIIYFLVIFIFLPAVVIRNRFSNYQLTGDKLISINPDKPIIFQFTPSHQSLNSLSFQLKNPNLLNRDKYQLTIADHQRQLLKSIDFYGSNVGDPSRLDLKFDSLYLDLKYPLTVTLSTQSTDSNQLFIFVDNQNNPVYYSTFKPNNFINSLLLSVNLQQYHLQSFPKLFFIIYLSFLLILNLLIIRNFLSDCE